MLGSLLRRPPLPIKLHSLCLYIYIGSLMSVCGYSVKFCKNIHWRWDGVGGVARVNSPPLYTNRNLKSIYFVDKMRCVIYIQVEIS
jgi:hypothetical protein